MSKPSITKNGIKKSVPHLESIFADAGYSGSKELALETGSKLSTALNCDDPTIELEGVSQTIHADLTNKGLIARFDEIFMLRNFRVANSVSPYLSNSDTVLDVQTGTGLVTMLLSEMKSSCFFDVTEDIKGTEMHGRHPMCSHLSWIEKPEGDYDVIMFLTELHHCFNPEEVFRQNMRHLRPGGKIILLENTFMESDQNEKDINIFFDWFFHNCIHPCDYPCPNTHKSIEEWNDLLESEGFVVLESKSLGRLPMVKVIHHLWVAQKK